MQNAKAKYYILFTCLCVCFSIRLYIYLVFFLLCNGVICFQRKFRSNQKLADCILVAPLKGGNRRISCSEFGFQKINLLKAVTLWKCTSCVENSETFWLTCETRSYQSWNIFEDSPCANFVEIIFFRKFGQMFFLFEIT